MNQISSMMQDKKALIIFGVAIIFIVFIVFMIFLPSKSNQSFEIGTTPTPVQNVGGTLPGNPGQSGSAQPSYQNNLYSISFPIDYYATPATVDGVDGSVVLQQDVENSPKIEIQVYDGGGEVTSNISELMTGMGYKKRNFNTKNGYQAVEFSGQNNMFSELKERAVVIEKNGKVYKIQLSYKAAENILENENAFNDVVSSFKLEN